MIDLLVLLPAFAIDEKVLAILGGCVPGSVVLAIWAERNLIDLRTALVDDFAARHLLPIDRKKLDR